MGGLIPTPFIDELLRRTDILDLIESRLTLKKTGNSHVALCPFHHEKTPSFHVIPDKQFYHCFGCGASGSAIRFLMEHDNMGFVEAVEELAQRAGMEIPREAAFTEGSDHTPLYTLTASASTLFQEWLRHHEQAGAAIAYLKERGLSGEIAKTYQLGYAPPGWDNLKKALASGDPGVERQMVEGGLLAEKEQRRYDRFRDRIIFPIRDRRGRTIGFGGRVMGDEKPKYLNTPETPIFHKGTELYGLFEARSALRRITSMLVVEGYMDVIALAQFGVRNCVATLGTATSSDHLERLFRIVNCITFCFDGDRAGRDAAWKALQTALPLMRDGRDVRFLFLPEGDDPDSLIRAEGKEGLERRTEAASPLSAFLFERLSETIDLTSPEGRATLAEEAKPMLSRLPQGVYRDLLQRQLNDRVGLAVNVAAPPAAPPLRRPLPSRRAGRQQASLQRQTISWLLQFPNIARQSDLAEGWRALDEPGIPLLTELVDLIRNTPDITTGRILEHWTERRDFASLHKLAAQEVLIPEEIVAAEFKDALQRLAEKAARLEQDQQRERQLLERLGRERPGGESS